MTTYTDIPDANLEVDKPVRSVDMLALRDNPIALFERMIGCVFDYAGDTAPPGFLLCDGQAVSRTTYAALFDVIGTTYGAGDGSTTFNVPDIKGRVVAGKDDMGGTAANRLTSAVSGVDGATLGAAGGDQRMQAHQHTYTNFEDFSTGNQAGNQPGKGTLPNQQTGAAGAGNSQNVQPTIVLNKIIFYGVVAG